MSDSREPIVHLARGAEELLRAAADALALWRERERRPGSEDDPLAGLAAELERQISSANGPWLAALRLSLDREIERWRARGEHDPAASRVADLFEATREVLSDDSRVREPTRSTRRAPPRKATR